MSYCTKCGAENKEASAYCTQYGEKVVGDSANKVPASTVPDNQITAILENRYTIYKVVAVLLLLLFFIPACSVSCSSQAVQISPFTLMTGTDYFQGEWAAAGLFGLPVLMCLFAFAGKAMSKPKQLTSGVMRPANNYAEAQIVGVAIFHGIVLSAFMFLVNQEAQNQGAQFRLEFGFYLALLACLAVVVIGFASGINLRDVFNPHEVGETQPPKQDE